MQKIESMKRLGKKVHQARKEQGLTQEQLAATCGVGIRFIRELEYGKETCFIGKVLQVMHMLGMEIFVKKQSKEPL